MARDEQRTCEDVMHLGPDELLTGCTERTEYSYASPIIVTVLVIGAIMGLGALAGTN